MPTVRLFALAALMLSGPAAADSWDPGDDSSIGATLLPAPTTATQFHGPHDALDGAGDWEDWYAVPLTAGVMYHFDTTGSIGDAWLDVYDASVTWVDGDDDHGGYRQPSFEFVPDATATYYLVVGYSDRGWSGRLRYWSRPLPADPYDPADDTPGGAGLLPAPTAAVQSYGPLSQTGTDEDWFAIPLVGGTTVWIDTIGGMGDAWLEVFDASVNGIDSNDDEGGNRQPSLIFSATYTGLHYFRVGSNGLGWIGTVHYRLIPGLPDAWDPVDDVETGATTLLPTSSPQIHGPHVMDPYDCDDWFQFVGTGGTAYHFEFTGGPGATWADVIDPGGNYTAYDSANGLTPHFALDTFALISGLHRLDVGNDSCGWAWARGGIRYWRIETSEPGWTSTGLWHDVEDNVTPAGRPATGTSPRTFWYGGDVLGSYETGDDNYGRLVSPPYALPGSATLYFSSWAQTENWPGYDTRRVLISTDDGASWAPLVEIFGTEESWEAMTVTLTGFAGTTARFAFEFNTVSCCADNYLGWFIDDVRVDGTTAAVLRSALAVTPAAASGGATIQVVLSVTNSGTAAVNGVMPSLGLASGAGFATYVGGPSPAGPVMLTPAGSQRFTWTYQVAGTGTAVFSGSATGTEAVTLVPVSASATASVVVQTPAMLATALAVTPARAQVGTVVTLVATITNTGGSTATGVGTALGIGPPAIPLTLVTGPSPAGPLAIPAGGSANITWTYSAAGLGTATFNAVVSGTDAAFGGAVGAAASASFVAKAALLSATLQVALVASPSPVGIGRWVTVTGTVTNAGDRDAAGVVPVLGVAGLAYSLIAGPVPAGPLAIPGGAAAVFTWTVSPSASGTGIVSVTASGTDAVSGGVITGSAVGSFLARHAILTASLTAPTSARTGEAVEIRLTVNNPGTGAVNALTPSVTGPGLTVVAGPSPGSASLAAGAAVTFVWSVRLDQAGPVTITANVTGTDAVDAGTVTASASAAVTVSAGFNAPLVAYPNPVTGDVLSLAVRAGGPALRFRAEVWNVASERVYEGSWSAAAAEATLVIRGLLGWSPGLYAVRVTAELADGTTEVLPLARVMVQP